MKAPAHTAFLDLEEALAARLRQSWSRYWSALSADILQLTAQGKFDEAHRLADTLELAPLFDKARPYARTIGMSALLLGASRITPSIRDSRIAKLPPKDKLDGYLNQLNVMLARNATQALREQAHLWITEEEQKLVKGEWREEDHPRGKTTPESNSGSFAPADRGPYGNAEVRTSKRGDRLYWLGATAGTKYGNPDFVAWQFEPGRGRDGRAHLTSLTFSLKKDGVADRQAAAKDLLIRAMEEGKKHGLTVFDLREHYEGRVEEDDPLFDESHPNYEDYAWLREFITTDPRLMSLNGSYLVSLYDATLANKPVHVEGYKPSMRANFLIASHGTRMEGWSPEKALDAGEEIHLGTRRAAEERVGLRYSPTGFATFGVNTREGTPTIHEVTVDARTIDRIHNPEIENQLSYASREQRAELSARGIYGMAYINRVEDPDSLSLMIWDKRALRGVQKAEWNEEDHPRGKTTPESNEGSFAPKGTVDFWHGTVPQFLESIKKEGLRVKREQRNNPGHFYRGPRGNAVFVATTEDKAFDYAHAAAYERGRIGERLLSAEWDENLKLKVFDTEEMVLHFRVPQELADQFKQDRMSERAAYFEGTLPPEYLVGYKVRRYDINRRLLSEEAHRLAKSDLVDLYVAVLLSSESEPVAKADADRNQVKILTAGKQYFALAASVQVSRLSAFGFLAEAAEKGITNYRVDAVLDERTCEVCRHMDGWVFPVEAGFALATQIMETDDPDALKSIAPFYAQNKGSLAALATYGTEDFIETGMSLPPYHPLCRCILTPTEETADVHPTDRSDRVALASQTLYGEGDGVRLTQNLFGVERLPEEADTVEAPAPEEDSRLLEMLRNLFAEPAPASEASWQRQALSRLLVPEVQPAALVSPTPFEGTTIPSKWVKPFDPAQMAQLATSKWPWLAALLGWMALRQPEQASAFATDEDEEDEEDTP